jgi:hypothetical protein
MTTAIIIAIIIIVVCASYTRYDRLLQRDYNQSVTVSVSDFASSVQPGDIILGHFHCTNPLHHLAVNRVYPAVLGDIQTHVAVVVRDPSTGQKYIYDTHPSPRHDDYYNRRKATGPALILPQNYPLQYEGTVFWIPQNSQNSQDERDVWSRVMTSTYRTFDWSLWRMTNSVLKIGTNPRRTHRNVFCSESVAEVMGWSNPTTTSPHDIKTRALSHTLNGNMYIVI